MPIRPPTPPKPRAGILRHWAMWSWFVTALVLLAGGVCLWRSGRWLVREDPVAHARWGLVLAGESRDCERTDAGIRLFREGRVDTLILSGTRIFKDRFQSEFMADYAARQGVPRDRLFEFRQDAYSTQEEAALLIRQFRLQNLDTVVVVTSNFHTARTRRIFRKLAQGYPVVLVAAADYPMYDPAAWWTNRESRKIWFYEWAKTAFTAWELWRARPIIGKAEFQGLTPDPGGEGYPDPASAANSDLNAGKPGRSDGPEKEMGPADSAAGIEAAEGSGDADSSSVAAAADSDSLSGADPKSGDGKPDHDSDSVSAKGKNGKRAPAAKASQAASQKSPAAPTKAAPRREDKKADKSRKKG